MNKPVFCFLLLLTQLNVFAQKTNYKNYDSVAIVYSALPEDTIKAFKLSELAYAISQMNPGKSIELAEEGLRLANKFNYKYVQASATTTLALVKSHMGESETSAAMYIEAITIAKELHDEPLIARIYYLLGTLYQRTNDLEEANTYLSLALEKYILLKNTYRQAVILDALGIVHENRQAYYKALGYHQKAIALMMREKNRRGLPSFYINIGVSYLRLKNYKKCIQYMDMAKHIYDSIGEPVYATIYLNKASSYLGLEQFDRALTEVNIGLKKAEENKDLGHKILAVNILSEIKEKQGDHKKALEYHLRADEIRDSIFNADKTRQIAEMQAKYKTALKDEEIQKQQISLEKHKQFIYAGLAIAVLLLVIGLLAYNYNRLRHKQIRAGILAQKQRTEEQLALSEEKLNTFTHSILEKNELISQLQEEISKQNTSGSLSLGQLTILTNQQWEDFRVLFEKVHSGYLQRLKDKLPDLSPAETRFMTLAKLNFSSKQMADTLGIGTDAIRMMRHRLRKKLNFTEEGSLEELIAGI